MLVKKSKKYKLPTKQNNILKINMPLTVLHDNVNSIKKSSYVGIMTNALSDIFKNEQFVNHICSI